MGQQIDVNHLNIYYGDFLAVEDVNINIAANKVTAFIGPSGCGKSTVLRTLDRMHEITPGAHCTGKVLLEGRDLYAKDVDPVAVRRDIGMVFQRPNPFPTMSIRENVLAGVTLNNRKITKSDADDLVEWALRGANLWNEVKDRLDNPGIGLSGGQQQRLCIARAVAVNFDYLSDRDRLLKNLWESCFSSSGPMRAALKKWVDPLQYGEIFNESADTLDLQSRLTTFDFTEILQDETLAPAVISYILHRINNITVSGGNPSLIMIDETAPMLENKMFRDNFITGLQEGRKNRQAYMVAFQRANVLDKLGIGDVVRGQAQTVLFFRNPAADANDYAHWNLNPLEMAFIQGKAYPNLKRAVLLSRPVNGESVILNTELGGLGNLLKLFESGRSSVLLAEELYKTYGNNFVAEYLKKQGGGNL